MISCYCGLPGSGKSYGVVAHVILPALQQNREILTNIPLNMDKIKERFPDAKIRQFTWEQVKEEGESWWASLPAGGVWVFDEVWHIWAAGTLAKDIPECQREALAMHRHKVGEGGHSTEIILICQDLATVAKMARNLVERTYRMTKLNAVGMDNRYSVHVYQGSVEGQTPPKGRLISTYHGKYTSDIYELYTSHTQSESGVAGLEKVLDKRGNVFKSPSFKYGALFILAGSAWAIYHLVGVVSSFGKDEAPEPPPSIPGISAAVASPKPEPYGTAPSQMVTRTQAATEVAPPSYSTVWRLSGTYQIGGSGRALLQSADGRVKTVLLSECSFDGRDFECRLGNELVSRWTGQTKPTDNMVESGFALAGSSVRAAMR